MAAGGRTARGAFCEGECGVTEFLEKQAEAQLIENIVGQQEDDESKFFEYLFMAQFFKEPTCPRKRSLSYFRGIEHSRLYSLPLSIVTAFVKKEDVATNDYMEADIHSWTEIRAREQFGMLCDVAQLPDQKQPHRDAIRALERAFWFEGPRSAEEIAAHRAQVLALAALDENDVATRDFARNLSPRSSLSPEDRVLRDYRQALDWVMVQSVRLVEAEIAEPFGLDDPATTPARQAFFRVMAAAAFAADYTMYDVFGADCACLRVYVGEDRQTPVDVTAAVRDRKDALFDAAAARLPDPDIPGYDRFRLIDLWRRGGGREAVMGEYPFWLKR